MEAPVRHEMAHCLGFGFWDRGLECPRRRLELHGLEGSRGECERGQGTQDGHWRQSVFGPVGEVMEGFANAGATARVPLSAVTIQSLADIGYAVDVDQADAYTLPSQAAGKLVASSARLIPHNCILHEPAGVIEEEEPAIRKPSKSKEHEK